MDYLQSVPVTQTTTKAGLAAGTTTTWTIANAVQYSIRGKAFAKSAVSNQASPTTDATTGAAFSPISANQGAVLVFSFDASGNVKVSQSVIQALDVGGNFIVSPQFPAIPDTVCPFGYLVFKGGATLSGTWTFGTNNLSSVTGATYTFVDVQSLPDRPQVS